MKGVSQGRYTREFREKAVKMVTEGKLSLPEAARRLSLPPSTLATWVKQFKAGRLGEMGQQVQEIARQVTKPESPNPMASMFTNATQPYFSHALSQMFGMFGGFGVPGGVMPPPSVQPGQSPPGGGQPSSVPPGSKQISGGEMEAAFNDE